MRSEFYGRNRQALALAMNEGDIAVFFSGTAPIKTADEYYPYFANRNFVYLTGIEQQSSVLVLRKEGAETLFLLPSDELAERWTGRRLKFEAASARSAVKDIRPRDAFEKTIDMILNGGANSVWLDLDRNARTDAPSEAFEFAAYIKERYPHIALVNAAAQLREQRLIKSADEIEAMREAETITRDGILAMMRAAKPGMLSMELKAEFDRALARRGAPAPAFPSIISSGEQNFYIHNPYYDSRLEDGDMVLNDVGAAWDGMCTDVSRSWPVNGKFSDKQRLLYECAYATSEHMFSILKPGMTQASVDATIRQYNFERLHEAGVCERFEDIGRLMWHGGAHHVGFDTHDVVDRAPVLAPGMVFCVDVGIYHKEWGIGFRLEDNCLMTENGCENLSKATPRSIEAIERVMAER